MRKILLTLLTAFLFTTITFGETTFKDINSSAWYYSSVSAIAQKGLIKGYEDGTFRPNNTLTYAEFIKMMTIAVSGQDVGNSTDGSYWAESYYNKGLELKLYDKTDVGYNAISMKDVLSSRIDRRHMALLIGNYLGDVKIENYADLLKTVSDVRIGSDYEYEIMEAYTAGILNGYSDGTFKPENTLSRKEAATVLLRVIDPSQRVEVTYKEDPKDEEDNTYDYKMYGHSYTATDITLPYKSIVKTENSVAFFKQYGVDTTYLAVYSSKPSLIISVFADGVLLSSTTPADRNYYEKDGYYVYLFNASDNTYSHQDLKGKELAIQFAETSSDWQGGEYTKVYVLKGIKF